MPTNTFYLAHNIPQSVFQNGFQCMQFDLKIICGILGSQRIYENKYNYKMIMHIFYICRYSDEMESICLNLLIIFKLPFNKNMEFIDNHDELRKKEKKNHCHLPEEIVCGNANVCCERRISFVKCSNGLYSNIRNFSVMQNDYFVRNI